MADYYEKQRQKQANYEKEQKRKQDEFVRQQQYKSQDIYESNQEMDEHHYQKKRKDQQKLFDLQGTEKITNGLAFIALVFAILFPLMGIILGFIALNVIKKNPNVKGKGMAITAIVIGFLFTVFFPVFMVAFMILGNILSESNECNFDDSFDCVDYRMNGNSIIINIKSNVPGQIEDVVLQVGEVCEPRQMSMYNGMNINFKCDSPQEEYNGDMEIHYIKDDSRIVKHGTLKISPISLT